METKAVGETPENLLNAALGLLASGDVAGGRQKLDDLVRDHARYGMGWLRRGFLLSQSGDIERAVQDWETAMELPTGDGRGGRDTGPSLLKQLESPELRPLVEESVERVQKVTSSDSSVEAQVLLGRTYAALGRYALALQAFTLAMRLAPDEPEAGLGCAHVYFRLGQIEQAQQILQKLAEQHPNSAPVFSSLGKIYLSLNSTALAVRYLEKATALNAVDAPAHLALGEIFLKQGRAEQAMSRFQKALAHSPDNFAALLGMAECSKELYRFEEAISYYQRATKTNPRDHKALSEMGKLCIQLGGLDLAIDCLHQALELNPNDVEAYSTLAKAYQQRGEIATAAQYFAKTVSLNPKDFFAAYNLGLIYRGQGKIQEAADLFAQAASLRPSDSQYQYQFARAQLELGRMEQAIEASRKAVSLNPHSKEIQLLLGRACLETGQYHDALEASKVAANIDQQSPDAHYQTGVSYLHLGQVEEASKSFTTVLRFAPTHAPSLHGLGHIQRRLGNVREAIDFYLKAILTDPSQKQTVHELTRLYLESGREREILAVVDSVLQRRGKEPQILAPFFEAWLEVLAPNEEYQLGSEIVEKFAGAFPNHPSSNQTQSRWHLGWARRYLETGHVEQARSSLAHLLKAQPNLVEAQSLLAELDSPRAESIAPPELLTEKTEPPAPPTLPEPPVLEPVPEPEPVVPEAAVPQTENAAPKAPPEGTFLVLLRAPHTARNSTAQASLLQRTLDLALDLEVEGWFREACLMLSLANEIDPASPGPTLQQNRIVHAWATRLEREGKTELANELHTLHGVVAPSAPRRSLASAVPLLEPPPSSENWGAIQADPSRETNPWNPPAPISPPVPVTAPVAVAPQGDDLWNRPSAEVAAVTINHPPLAPTPVAPVEFEFNLTGQEDLPALLKLARRHPEESELRLALYRRFHDDTPSLVKVYRDIAQEATDEPMHVLNLARAYAQTGSDSLAVLQFRKYVKQEATSEGYRELGEVYGRMGKAELAAQAQRRSEQLAAEEAEDDQ